MRKRNIEYGLYLETWGWLANCDVDLTIRGKSKITATHEKELALTFDSSVNDPEAVLNVWNPILQKELGSDFAFECVEL